MENPNLPTKVKDLLTGPDRWTQGQFARDSVDDPVEWTDSGACKFCLLGAVRTAYPTWMWPGVEDKIINSIQLLFPHRFSREGARFDVIVAFNDHPDTRFDDVHQVLETANV